MFRKRSNKTKKLKAFLVVLTLSIFKLYHWEEKKTQLRLHFLSQIISTDCEDFICLVDK